MSKEIGFYVTLTRKGSGLSRRAFAEELCSKIAVKRFPQTIKAWEEGQFTPSDSFLQLILSAYGPEDWQTGFARDIINMKSKRKEAVPA